MDKLLQLESIQGTDFVGLSTAELTGVKKVLAEFANRVVKDSKANLIRGNHIASDSLNASIVPLPVKEIGGGYMVEIQMNDYWKFVNEGVRGAKSGAKAQGSPFQYKTKMPPRQSIEEWITNKGINPGGTRGQRENPRASLAGVIQRRIYNFGTPRTLFLDKALPESLMKALTEDVAEAFGKSISISIKV
jgi:hypothetical protein